MSHITWGSFKTCQEIVPSNLNIYFGQTIITFASSFEHNKIRLLYENTNVCYITQKPYYYYNVSIIGGIIIFVQIYAIINAIDTPQPVNIKKQCIYLLLPPHVVKDNQEFR